MEQKERNKRKIAAFLAVCLLFSCCLLPGGQMCGAVQTEIPSLFANDEAWYRDAVSPLVDRDGVLCVPADMFAMFDVIRVTEPRDGNILLHHTESGAYVSVLLSVGSAAVNGEIVEPVTVFRAGDVWYVEAERTARALGLQTERFSDETGRTMLRVYDADSLLSWEELLDIYRPDAEKDLGSDVLEEFPAVEEIPSYDGKLKRIYVLCETAEPEDEFPAQEICERYGIAYTHFLSEKADAEQILRACAAGTYGVKTAAGGTAEQLDALNRQIGSYTYRRTRFTLSDGDAEADRALREAGYLPVRADFTVNGASDPDTMLVDMINYIGTAGSCTLFLEDCWNSEQMIILLSELWGDLYKTANLSDIGEQTGEEGGI